ncbi:MAG TPA: glycoside hydrolase family 9 protein, partial [Ilumatobacteraceae bacterium]|nr:glycoside hydrolase family 9 protein [Ilumatobacteraceae bacterium]
MSLLKIPARKAAPATGLVLVFTLIAAGSLSAPARAQIGENVRNGDFSAGTDQWFTTGNLTPTIVDGRLCVDVPGGTVNPWDAIVGQNDIALVQGVNYRYSYDVSSSVDGKNARALVGLSVAPFDAYFTANELLTTATASLSNTFEQPTSTDLGQVAFQIGGSPDPWTFCVDNVGLVGGGENVRNGDFSAGTDQWFTTGNLTPTIVDGRLCVDVPGGTVNPWDAIVGQNDIALVQGVTYQYSYDISSSVAGRNVRALVGLSVAPFDAYFTATEQLPTTDTTSSSNTFEQSTSTDLGQVAFQIGGSADPWTFCVDNVSLAGGATPEPYVPDTGPRVRVNQVGYLPEGPKGATLVTEATDPLVWELKKASGQVVKSGLTRPAGIDITSGLNVHVIDFSRYDRRGDGFTLTVDGETSHPFDISSTAYEQLRVDALSLYYPQRSGTPILGEIAGAAYARAAGHVGAAPNTGDTAVPCQTPEFSQTVYGEPWTCDYTLDVTGGWYDAGDHGKYVVNGGISVAQLMSTWERNQNARHTDRALGDRTLPIPERGNRVPDVLDEARWELEWMLTMQVPAGEPLAGMVHHKVHDHQWTGLPLDPAADDKIRELHRPSTAATLNLAAVAAQGSRLFQKYDRAFSKELLKAARVAWTAANANPALYAPAADGNSGGGPYDDSDVTDEFYWAAAELYLTTGERQFKNAVLASPLHGPGQIPVDGFDWRTMAPLAQIDLATLDHRLPDQWRIRRWVLDGADAILALQRQQPWGQPYAPASNQWAWGSTAQILNNMVVLASAYDISHDDEYRDGVLEGMDFLFGRNALNISYVTGYGDVFSQNQHSRMYAHQLNASLPNPPVGTIAGGPNSSIQDPVAQRLLQGCAP